MSGRVPSNPSRSADGRLDSALENLVRQFARPLDCLRELVQNGIDAGSPRVEVALGWTPRGADEGVLSISVRDFGEGMDEHIIDNELTRMFASSKAGDLSKLGRFGVGFTSVFAINPELVHVETGRHGENWELVFHPDRSFDKLRRDRSVQGTRVTMFKPIPLRLRGVWRRDIEQALTFWCEHCRVPVTLQDSFAELAPATASASDLSDPFAQFGAPSTSPARTLTRPLDLPGSDFQVTRQVGDIEVHVGLGTTPSYRWYNGGLTLLSTSDPACLGAHAQRLGHLRFKAQCSRLEHTLTRDNVIQDAAWKEVIAELLQGAAQLEQKLLSAHAAAMEAGESGNATRAALSQVARHTGRLPNRVPVPMAVHHGLPMPLPERAEQAARAVRAGELTEALHKQGVCVFVDQPELHSIAAALRRPLPESVEADWLLVTPADAPAKSMEAQIARLIEAAELGDFQVHWCQVTGKEPPFLVHQAPSPHPVRRVDLQVSGLRRLLGVREVWVNLGHPTAKSLAMVARLAPELAAYTLLRTILTICDGPSARRDRAIRETVRP